MSTSQKTSTISVIIPTINEAENLGTTLGPLRNIDGLEIIVADGGSKDTTTSIAEEAGARVINSRPGRSFQQNNGAAAANGEILLFLHADTILPIGFAKMIHNCLAQKNTAAGAFSFSVDLKGVAMGIVVALTNFRAKILQLPYGDQALFMTRENFIKAGRFQEIEIMEDFALIGKLKKLGQVKILPAKIITSGRRWQKLGIIRTSLTNQAIIIGYFLGLSPTSLANWYRRSSKAR